MEYKITEGFSPNWGRILGHALEKIREERALPMRDLCTKAKVNKNTYASFVEGNNSVTTFSLLNILNVLNVDLILKPREDVN